MGVTAKSHDESNVSKFALQRQSLLFKIRNGGWRYSHPYMFETLAHYNNAGNIISSSDEHYTTYYPTRALAGYIPAYLVLLFVFAPILYMGLNMLSCPSVDSIDGIWDTRSNLCCNSSVSTKSDDDHMMCSVGTCSNGCNNDSFINGNQSIESLPTLCDKDVRMVNSRIRLNMQRNKS